MSHSPCYVRPAAAQDLHQLAEVLTSSFYPPLGWWRWLYPALRFGIYEDLKQRLQGGATHYTCLAAIADKTDSAEEWVVGTVEISCRHRNPWLMTSRKHLYLSNLAVRANCRRQGIARQLLQGCEQRARQWGFHEIYLHVMEDNARARHLYQSMGYHVHRVEITLWSLLVPRPRRLLLRKVIPQAAPSPKSPVR